MNIIFIFIYISLLIFLSITLINSLAGPLLKVAKPPIAYPLVSLLIPARNEEQNIAECLNGLRRQDYLKYEIIVIDDVSEDNTSKIVAQIAKRDSRIRLVKGRPLPDGWVGKNWACHQLSKAAKGEILIFTDADNRHESNAITNTIGWMQSLDLGMLSAFPQQITKRFSEKLIVPVIDLLLYSSLVLWLTYYTKYRALAAANGQWIAFRQQVYENIGGHQTVKEQLVEDVELSRLAKNRGIKILTMAGTGILYARMYHSFQEIWNGFTKNLFGLTENKFLPFLAILIGLLFTHILPFLLLSLPGFSKYAVIAVALALLIRLTLVLRYKHPFFESVFLHPLSILMTIFIGINSLVKVKFGKISWKGRYYKVS